jgi:signal transduction histidine kinase
MKIKTIIYLSLLLLSGSLLLFSAILIASSREQELASQNHARANAIIKNGSTLRALTFEYILSPDNRAKTQWNISYNNITKLLTSYPQTTSKEKELLTDIKDAHHKLQTIFTRLIALKEKNNTTDSVDVITSEIQNRLIAEVLTQSQVVVTNSLVLADITYKQTVTAQIHANLFVGSIIAILVFVFLTLFVVYKRKILMPLSQLEKATQIVSRGNLDYLVPIFGKDEMGSLAQSFNNMTAKLKDLDLMKSDFLRIAAHQLRTPLGTMRWEIEQLLRDTSQIPAIKPPLQQIYDKILSMISLMSDLMAVYLIDQKNTKQNVSSVNIKETIQTNLENIAKIADEKKITLTSTITIPNSLQMKMDLEKWNTCLRHVLSNALLYNKATNGHIDVQVSNTKNTVKIVIKDTGIGIAKKDIPHMFSRFYRAPNAQLSQPNGNGLGLFVVKFYVEEMGGHIYLDSRENEGTTVTIELPI